MKILIIAYACEPDSISESFLAYETICGVAEKLGGEVHVLTRANNLIACRNDKRAADLGIKWHGYDGGKLLLWMKKRVPLFSIQFYALYWQFRAAVKARKLSEKENFDLVHGASMMSLHNFAAGLVGLPALIGPIGGAQEVPSSCRSYGDPIQEILRRLSIHLTPLLPGWRRAFKSVRKIYCANTETESLFVKQGIPSDRLVIRQPGYPGITATDECTVAETLADIKIPTEQKLSIFWGGRLVRCKGLELLLDAVASARRSQLDVVLHVTGDGPDRKRFERTANRLGISDCVYFHGWLPLDEMKELRKSCGMLAFTSLRETTGLALIEMLLSGQPVAVLNCGGPRAIIDGLACFSIQPESAINDLLNAMASILNDPKAADQNAEKVKPVAVKRFDWNSYLNDLISTYREVLNIP
jgi:glycosyltransferase involved in cell wall biosynthesis